MQTITCLAAMWAVLFNKGILGIENPRQHDDGLLRQYAGTSMMFSWETVSRLDDYLVRGQTFYDPSQGYRFDADNGFNRLYILPYLESAYYYFPTNENGRPVEGCYKVRIHPKPQFLPEPILNERNPGIYRQNGDIHRRGEWVIDYTLTSKKGDGKIVQNDVFFPRDDYHRIYPVASRLLMWNAGETRLEKHEETEYFDFHFGFIHSEDIAGGHTRPNNIFWPLKQDNCLDVTWNQSERNFIIDYAEVVHVPDQIKLLLERPISSSSTRSAERWGSSLRDDDEEGEKVFRDLSHNLPPSWDWRNYGAVTPVKNQRDCGSCWAFGAIAALESAYFLTYNKIVDLSEQHLIDCSWTRNNKGCEKGSPAEAFQWMNYQGARLADGYDKYKNMNGICRQSNYEAERNHNLDPPAKVAQLIFVPRNNSTALKSYLVEYGPVVVHIDARPFNTYTSGIITDCNVALQDHFVLVVGYGQTGNQEPFWIVKNSWGSTWGMNGYALISAKDGENCLGILDEPLIPALKQVN